MAHTKGIAWHLAKLVVLVGVAICSIVFSKDLFGVLLSSLTFTITILFDAITAACISYKDSCPKWMKVLVVGLAFFIASVFLSGCILTLYVALNSDFDGITSWFVGIFMIVCAFASIVSEYLINKYSTY